MKISDNFFFSSSNVLTLREMQQDVDKARMRTKDPMETVRLEEMSHSDLMSFLKHDLKLSALKESKVFHDAAKAEVKRVLDGVKSIREDLKNLQNKTLSFNSKVTPHDLNHATYRDRLKKVLESDRDTITQRVQTLAHSLRTSDIYSGKTGPIALGSSPSAAYSINHFFNWSLNRNTTTSDALDNFCTTLVATIRFVSAGTSITYTDTGLNKSITYLDEILLPHLTQDLATAEKASGAIQNEIETHEAFLNRFYLTQEDRDLKLREMEERRHRFFVSLWREMEWSKKIFNMMNGISA
jgi:hypothetical protein